MSALPPRADMVQHYRDVCFVPKADSCTAANSPLFDHLVGDGKQRRRDSQAEHCGGLIVDHQLELVRLYNRQPLLLIQRLIVGSETRIRSEKSGASSAASAASLIRERRLNSLNGSVVSTRPEW